MKAMIFLLGMMCSMLVFSLESQAVTLDFEGLAHTDEKIVDHGAVYLENGFLITNTATEVESGFPPSLATFGTEAWGYAGSTALFNDNSGGETVLAMENGGLFNLVSMALAELYPVYDPQEALPFEVSFKGLQNDGDTVFQTFSLDGLSGIELFLFGGDFSNLVAVSWLQTPFYHQFDEITVQPVPEPASLFLMGSGLVTGALISKRRLHH